MYTLRGARDRTVKHSLVAVLSAGHTPGNKAQNTAGVEAGLRDLARAVLLSNWYLQGLQESHLENICPEKSLADCCCKSRFNY